MRDKDAVIASMLLAEAAAWYKKRGMTLYEGLMELYEKYGYYSEKVTSFALEGKDGLSKMVSLMANLRAGAPESFAGKKVLAVRDYKKGVRTAAGAEEKLDYRRPTCSSMSSRAGPGSASVPPARSPRSRSTSTPWPKTTRLPPP